MKCVFCRNDPHESAPYEDAFYVRQVEGYKFDLCWSHAQIIDKCIQEQDRKGK